ncbi:FtsK/SpoIIIE domain-containing protein [Agromyces albus]|uniref:FtsK/SpoIIIE domain-containing protein n=1 Tax=Agromyces albus TaxID=205332 RepID=UPI00278A4FE7|nr:FtsK/SpoIIIE domain-containing protein [Agromyces albus]MDQ0574828.1 S-DNA-T family DNA segregation ATPase FtsK/SpoIIIE [Agromyces albus]
MDRLDLASPHPLDLPLALPPVPPEATRAGFPLLATLAPVVGALGLWAVTGSTFALVFAALGPVVAIASLFDSRRQARRQRRRAEAERARRLDALHAAIDERHEYERHAAWRRSSHPRHLVDGDAAPSWNDGRPGPVVLGRGSSSSTLRIDGSPADDADRAVLEHAALLADAPVTADPEAGIGFVGTQHLVSAAARAALLQVAHHGVPGGLAIEVPAGEHWAWARRLPHHGGGSQWRVRVVDGASPHARQVTAERVGVGASVPVSIIAVGADAASLPPGIETVVEIEGPGLAIVHRRTGAAADRPIVPGLIGGSEALAWAGKLAAAAKRAGIGGAHGLPKRVPLDSLGPPAAPAGSRATLAVAVGVTSSGTLELDLVRGGPHALVAGTTGSGKSEFLLAWLTALARAHRPDRVSFLLIDFKGGAAFEPIRSLPHVAGIVTDLDEAEAERAVLSLRAELRHRESVLAAASARDIADLAPVVSLARLVIVVDEFQAMIERFPGLGAVIGDIAARGRSLGVHLVLASQRPNGVVREQVTANCAIRVSLRVMQRSDSVAVVGTDTAASIPPDAPGHGVIDPGDGCPVPFHSAVADPALLAATRAMTATMPRARRPWLDPLPHRIAPDELDRLVTPSRPMPASAQDQLLGRPLGEPHAGSSGCVALGLVDEPELQRRAIATWTPDDHGHLLVLGAPGSGRSTALSLVARAIAEQHGPAAVVRLEGPRSVVWDTIQTLLVAVRRGGEPPRLLVIDDLDSRFRGWPDEYRQAASEAVAALLREGRSRGLAVVASAAQQHSLGPGVRESFGEVVRLRYPSRSDLVQAGGAGELWRAGDPPGSGQWRGRRVQLVDDVGLPPAVPQPVRPLTIDPARVHAVVTPTPRAAAEVLAAHASTVIVLSPGAEAAIHAALTAAPHGGRPVFIGDADAWAMNWSLASAIREDAVIVAQGGSAEYRALVRDRTLPPLLDDGAPQCWVIGGAGAAGAAGAGPAVRATWPIALGN